MSDAPVKRPRGRPSIYSPELADIILDRLRSGETLNAICRDDGMPAHSTVSNWATTNVEGFFDRYSRAREAGWHVIAEQIIDISDDSSADLRKGEDGKIFADQELVGRARLRVDSRKWLLSKMLPKIYGDKVEVNATLTLETLVNDSLRISRDALAPPTIDGEVSVIGVHNESASTTPKG